MKIRSLIFCLFATLTITAISGCNIFKGGSNCDCPKFGHSESSHSDNTIAFANVGQLDA